MIVPSTPPVKMCSVFFVSDGTVLVEGVDYEPNGPGGLASKVRVRLSSEALEHLLGMVVLRVLDQSKIVDGSQYDDKDVMRGRLVLTGARSNRAFETNAKCLEIAWKDSAIEILPTVYQSTHGGWYKHLPEKCGTCDALPDKVCGLLLAKVVDCVE